MNHQPESRRTFLKSAAATAAATSVLSTAAFAAGNDVLRVGLVGCGGRGTGEQMGGKSIARRRGRWMRYCPKDIHGHDALPGSEVPLSHSLV